MFKHIIEYTDFNGVERNEAFYFHLSLPEVTRIEAKLGTSLAEHTNALVERKDPDTLITFLESIILSSYGRKTSDGRTFQKTPELRAEFEYSQAYADFFEQVFTDGDLARKFGEGVAETGKAKKNTVAPVIVT